MAQQGSGLRCSVCAPIKAVSLPRRRKWLKDIFSRNEPITSAKAFKSKMATTRRIRLALPYSSLPHPARRGAASVYDLMLKYSLFGKALLDLFGILAEIEDRMNNNPV